MNVTCLPRSSQAVCSRVSSLEALRERSEHEVRGALAAARHEEVLRLSRAMHRLRTYTGETCSARRRLVPSPAST